MITQRLSLLVTFSLLFAAISATRAATRSWDGTTGNWDVPTNWSDDTVPSNSDIAYVANGGTATLPTGVNRQAETLTLRSGAVSISGGSLQLSSGFATLEVSASASSNATLTISSGTLTNNTEGGLNVSSYFASGTSNVIVDGGVFNTNQASIQSTSSGSASLTVNSGTFNTSSTVRLDSGSLFVDGGIVNGEVIIGTGISTGNSSVTVSSGTLNGSVTVGSNSTGSLLVEGGLVSSSNAMLGDQNTGRGTATVTGQGSQWTVSGSLTVGQLGSNNTLTIENAGLVKVGDASGESIAFSTNGGTGNFLRLDGGYIALFGNQTSNIASFITASRIQLWDGSAWVTATAEDVEVTHYANNAEGEAAAQTATGYSGLGGYTVATVVPEPSTMAMLLLSGAALLLRRRKARV